MIVFNCTILSLITYVFLKHSMRKYTQNGKEQEMVLAIVRIVGVMVLLGLTWILGAFTIKGASLLFQWLFVICNTLQGIFIFILFVVVNKNLRSEFKNLSDSISYKGNLKMLSNIFNSKVESRHTPTKTGCTQITAVTITVGCDKSVRIELEKQSTCKHEISLLERNPSSASDV